jgi:hypothetical protein
VAALIDACIVRIGAVPIPLKRAAAVLLSGAIQSIEMSPAVLVLAARRLLALRCRPNTPESGRNSTTVLVVDPGSGCIVGHMNVPRGVGSGVGIGVSVGVDVRKTWEGRGGTGKDVRRKGSIRERSRLQLVREPPLSGELGRGPDGSPVNRGRGALRGSGTGMGSGTV